jgi:hypothetical protein
VTDLDSSLRELPPPAPSAALAAAVAAALPVKTRRPLRTFAGVLLVSLACATCLVIWGLGVRRDLGSVPVGPLGLYALASVVSFAALLAAALVPPRGQVLPGGDRAAKVAALVTVVMIAIGVYVGTHVYGDAPVLVLDPRLFGIKALACLASGSAVAAAPAAAGLWALRRLIPVGAWRAGLAVGGAAGVIAGLALQLHCPIIDVTHVAVAHGGMVAAPAVLLSLLGARLLRIP